jgi:DNA polymerase elongation subunit (family B)
MISLEKTLFLDIETVSQQPDYTRLDDRGRKLWEQKIGFLARKDDSIWGETEYGKAYADRAAIYAEFGKVIVISTGIITFADHGPMMQIQSFYGHEEKQLLNDFNAQLVKRFSNPKGHIICGHNIKEFDIPYLCRRMTVHQIPLPDVFNIAGKKPWELNYFADTFELWKFGDYKNFTSLDLLSYTLDIPSPKNNMDGSMVGKAYWQENKLDDIRKYCERDVLTVAQVYLRLNHKSLLDEDQVMIMPIT